jgi:type II secretory pathway pseudopilin PulG
MIQKLKKAQALTEMAIFGTLILLCLHYLFTYTQRMNEQQYVAQEAFRGALEKARSVDGSASYTVFSNRRGASINNPLVGDTIQVSGSGSVLWGKGGGSGTWYKFGSGERDVSDLAADIEETEIVSNSETNLSTQINYNTGNIVSSQRASGQKEVTYNFNDSSGTSIVTHTETVGPLKTNRSWTVEK